jgi:hypothetical protein
VQTAGNAMGRKCSLTCHVVGGGSGTLNISGENTTERHSETPSHSGLRLARPSPGVDPGSPRQLRQGWAMRSPAQNWASRKSSKCYA